MMFKFLTACVVVATALAAPSSDLITELPGLNYNTTFLQYSGYLNGDNNTFLHYWFTESQNDPSTDPLLLWLNGGPGCSSMDGLLNELGPFHINLHPDGSTSLYENKYSWNTFANVLFLESPACVGFSYSTESCFASDESTFNNNYLALKHFFEKFPSFRNNSLFITGESYAGVYVPTLTRFIVENIKDYPLNLEGYAVGNGLSSYLKNDDSIIFFAYYHGLIGETNWGHMVDACCIAQVPSRDTCNFAKSSSPNCNIYVKNAMDIVYNEGLNMYNLYADCETPAIQELLWTVPAIGRDQIEKHNIMRHHKWFASSFGLTESLLTLDPPCTNSAPMNHFFNNPEVRKAIHIPDNVGKWAVCNDQVNANYVRQFDDMSGVYRDLRTAGVRGLVYNGDVDMACNYLGDQWFVEELEFPTLEPRRMWKFGGQVGGFVKKFDSLDLLTVRGSGHMVPQDKPGPALHMIKSFVQNTPY